MHRSHAFLLCFIFVMLAPDRLVAQQYDKVWALGSPVSTLTFSGDSVTPGLLTDSTTLSFNTIGSICDSSGNFLFYSNGLAVRNRDGHIMPHGDSLSYPSRFYAAQVPQGVASEQALVILPFPNNTNLYCIFHYTSTDTVLAQGGYEANNLYYSIVDMRLDSGRGDLTEKNVPILQHQILSASRIAACRHANGRDWWIVQPAWHENIYYKLLLTPEGIKGPYIQQTGPKYGVANELHSYSVFSPDGGKFASVTPVSYVVVMDFDRCSGLFSNPDSIYNNDSSDPIHNPISGGTGLAFSPNSRYLYVDNPIQLNQYDLQSAQIGNGIEIENDTNIYQMGILQLAPNGNIYIGCWAGGSYKIHVINHPDSLGAASGFSLLGQSINSQSALAIPYFPNFRLGALPGACDTITTDLNTIAAAYPSFASIGPNPASDRAEIIYYTGSNTVNEAIIYDMNGKEVWSTHENGSYGTMVVNLAKFQSGIYMVRLIANNDLLLSTKLIVTH
jgi:hypothetical protein